MSGYFHPIDGVLGWTPSDKDYVFAVDNGLRQALDQRRPLFLTARIAFCFGILAILAFVLQASWASQILATLTFVATIFASIGFFLTAHRGVVRKENLTRCSEMSLVRSFSEFFFLIFFGNAASFFALATYEVSNVWAACFSSICFSLSAVALVRRFTIR